MADDDTITANVGLTATTNTAAVTQSMIRDMQTFQRQFGDNMKKISDQTDQVGKSVERLGKATEEAWKRKMAEHASESHKAFASFLGSLTGVSIGFGMEELARKAGEAGKSAVETVTAVESSLVRMRHALDATKKEVVENESELRKLTAHGKELPEIFKAVGEFGITAGLHAQEALKYYPMIERAAHTAGLNTEQFAEHVGMTMHEMHDMAKELPELLGAWGVSVRGHENTFYRFFQRINPGMVALGEATTQNRKEMAAYVKVMADIYGEGRLGGSRIANAAQDIMEQSRNIFTPIGMYMREVYAKLGPDASWLTKQKAVAEKLKELGIFERDPSGQLSARAQSRQHELGLTTDMVVSAEALLDNDGKINEELKKQARGQEILLQQSKELEETWEAIYKWAASVPADVLERALHFGRTTAEWQVLQEEIAKRKAERENAPRLPSAPGGEQGRTPKFGVPPMQHGGIVNRPTLVMAGEAGPERIEPLHGDGRDRDLIANTQATKDNTAILLRLSARLDRGPGRRSAYTPGAGESASPSEAGLSGGQSGGGGATTPYAGGGGSSGGGGASGGSNTEPPALGPGSVGALGGAVHGHPVDAYGGLTGQELFDPLTGTSLGGGLGGHSAMFGPGQHEGVDIMAPVGSPVFAAFPKAIVRAVVVRGLDGSITIEQIGSDGRSTGIFARYLHQGPAQVRVNDTVTGGQVIGSSGYRNAAHTHFELWRGSPSGRNSSLINPRAVYGWNNQNLPRGGQQRTGAAPVAMQYGGEIKEHVVGIGESGQTYTFGEAGPETVIPASARGFIRAIGQTETGFDPVEANKMRYNLPSTNVNVRKYGGRAADLGFYQMSAMDAEYAINKLGMDPTMAHHLHGGGMLGSTVEQQTTAVHEYIKRRWPQAYDRLLKGDFEGMRRTAQGTWFGLHDRPGLARQTYEQVTHSVGDIREQARTLRRRAAFEFRKHILNSADLHDTRREVHAGI